MNMGHWCTWERKCNDWVNVAIKSGKDRYNFIAA